MVTQILNFNHAHRKFIKREAIWKKNQHFNFNAFGGTCMLMDLLLVSSSDGKNYLMMQFEASFNLGVNPEQNWQLTI